MQWSIYRIQGQDIHHMLQWTATQAHQPNRTSLYLHFVITIIGEFEAVYMCLTCELYSVYMIVQLEIMYKLNYLNNFPAVIMTRCSVLIYSINGLVPDQGSFNHNIELHVYTYLCIKAACIDLQYCHNDLIIGKPPSKPRIIINYSQELYILQESIVV